MLSKKIGILYLYYGSWPWFFAFFLKSCAYNSNITFIVITDLELPEVYPGNIKFVSKPFDEIRTIASDKLGFEVSLPNPYKLCDYKPLYGFLFHELLKDFDFWGHGDVDLIFGRIDRFINDNILSAYEIISVRNEYPTGFFMLFKNNKKTNELFKQSNDYRKVLTSSKHFSFGECNFQHFKLMQGIDIFETDASIESMMHVIKKAENNNSLKPYFRFHVFEGIPSGTITWNRGILTYSQNNSQREILLFHFIALKKNIFYKIPKWKYVPDKFFIDSFGFFKYSKKTFIGSLLRKKNFLKISIRKKLNKMMLSLNKFFLVLNLNSNINQNFLGIYSSGHRIIKINFVDNIFYLQYLLPFFEFSTNRKYVLSPVLINNKLFFNYESKTLYKFSPDRITITNLNGHQVVLKSINVEKSL